MKKIIESLKKWRADRNITCFNKNIKQDIKGEISEAKEELINGNKEAYAVEIADVAIFAFNGLGTMKIDSIYYPYQRLEVPDELTYLEYLALERDRTLISLDLKVMIAVCKSIIVNEGYDFEKLVLEKIKVISSREQDPKQKKIWKMTRVSGKWEKNKLQNPDTIYKGDFEGCKRL